MMDIGWAASVAPIVLGAGVGLAVRRVLAANDHRRAEATAVPAEPKTPSPAARPKADKTLRHAVPAGQR